MIRLLLFIENEIQEKNFKMDELFIKLLFIKMIEFHMHEVGAFTMCLYVH